MMFRNRVKAVVLSLAVLATGMALLLHTDTKKAVEALLQKGRTAVESKNSEKLMPLIALFYRDDLGFTYASLREGFDYLFSHFNDVRVDYHIVTISAGKDTAVADLVVWVRGTWAGGTQDIAGKESDPEPVSLLCKKEMFAWKVIGSRWPRRKPGMLGL
jgi:hypothetical protein